MDNGLILNSTIKETPTNEHLHIDLCIIGRAQTIKAKAMIDSRASTLFISDCYIQEHNMTTRKYPLPIRLLNIDRSNNAAGMVTDIGMEEVIMGIDWLRNNDPIISFKKGTLEIPQTRMMKAYTTTEEEERVEREVREELLGMEDEEGHRIREKLPKQYWKYTDLFCKSKAERLPEHSETDHAINLKPDFVPVKAKPYPLSKPQLQALEQWLEEQLCKGYIRPSKSPMSSPFFWVHKKGTTDWIDSRPCQDYRKLNEGTIKDNYPIPVI